MQPITFAVLGAGRIGRMHALILLSMPHVRLKTVLDKYEQTAWLPPGANVTVTADLTSILNDAEIDAILIATSSSSHVDLIKKIVPTKKAIFCEKPVSFVAAELVAIEKLVAAAGIKFQIGYNRRYDPSVMELKAALTRQEKAKFYMIKIKNRDPRRPPTNFIPKSGGMIFDFNAHDFDMLHFLSHDDVISVYTLGSNLIDKRIGALGDIDTAILSLRLKSGALAVIDCSRETGYGYDQEIEVFTSAGNFHVGNLRRHSLSFSNNTQTENSSGTTHLSPLRYDFQERYKEAYKIQLERFIRWVQTPPTPASNSEVGLHAGIRAICVAEAAARSLKSQQSETVHYLN